MSNSASRSRANPAKRAPETKPDDPARTERAGALAGSWELHAPVGGTSIRDAYFRGPGAPLTEKERAQYRPAVGDVVDQIRIHEDAAPVDSLSALAITSGRDIALAPGSRQDERTLTHELAHAAHASRGGPIKPGIASDAEPSERNAERAAARIRVGQAPDLLAMGTPSAIQRQSRGRELAPSTEVPGGHVSVHQGEEVPGYPGLPDAISLRFNGPNQATTHWLQFVWLEARGTLPSGASQPMAGSVPASGNDMALAVDPRAPIWSIDRFRIGSTPAERPLSPWLDDRVDGRANQPNRSRADVSSPTLRDETQVTVFDRPNIMAGAGPFRDFGRSIGASQVSLVHHFQTYLLQHGRITAVVSWTATQIVDVATGTARPGIAYSNVEVRVVSSFLPEQWEAIRLQFPDQYEALAHANHWDVRRARQSGAGRSSAQPPRGSR